MLKSVKPRNLLLKIFEVWYRGTICLLLVTFTIYACNSSKEPPAKSEEPAKPAVEAPAPTENRPPKILSLELTPQNPNLRDRVKASVQVEEPDGNSFTISYQWFVNGNPLAGEIQSDLGQVFTKGDRLECEVTVNDSLNAQTRLRSSALLIGNAAPTIKFLEYVPEKPGRNTGLELKVEIYDPDGDHLDVKYLWFENGKLKSDFNTEKIDGTLLKKRTNLYARIEVTDEVAKVSFDAPKIPISNSPPVIASVPPKNKEGIREYTYSVSATDPDGDPIKYAVSGVTGPTISDKGLLTWKPAANQSGLHKLRVTVTDDEGASAYQEFEITIRFQK